MTDEEAQRLLRRVDVLESREQIKELRAQYAWHAVRGEYPKIAELFTEDGVFEGPRGEGLEARQRLSGRDGIRAGLATMKRADVVPLVVNETFEIDGDRATGTCAMFSPVGQFTTGGFVGYYLDTLRRDDGTWLFTERRYLLYWPHFETP